MVFILFFIVTIMYLTSLQASRKNRGLQPLYKEIHLNILFYHTIFVTLFSNYLKINLKEKYSKAEVSLIVESCPGLLGVRRYTSLINCYCFCYCQILRDKLFRQFLEKCRGFISSICLYNSSINIKLLILKQHYQPT